MRKKFAIIIPSYDRVNVLLTHTLKMLKDYNYNGKIYVIVDDSDPQLEKYKEHIPEEQLYIFHKPDYYDYYDTCYNKKKIETKLYALGFIDELVNDLNLDYYYIIDDDIKEFQALKEKVNLNFNEIINFLIDFMDNAKSIDCLGFSPVGVYNNIGNVGNTSIVNYDMIGNYFFRKNHKLDFISSLNEEKGTIAKNLEIGNLMFTILLHDYKFGYTGIDWYFFEKDDDIGGNSKMYTYFSKNFYNYKYIELLFTLMVRPNYFNYIKLNNKISANSHFKSPKIIDERWKK